MPTYTEDQERLNNRTTAGLVHDEIPADHSRRAKSCHGSLFGRKFARLPAAASVVDATAKVERLDGILCKPKTPTPGTGHFAVAPDRRACRLTLREMNESAE